MALCVLPESPHGHFSFLPPKAVFISLAPVTSEEAKSLKWTLERAHGHPPPSPVSTLSVSSAKDIAVPSHIVIVMNGDLLDPTADSREGLWSR